MYEIKDKVFLVTGGAAGIGACVTKEFLEQGAKHVAVLDLDISNSNALETKYGAERIKFHRCDVTTNELEETFDIVFNEFGHIDCVVNSAGVLNDAPEVIVKAIEINVTAVIRSSVKAYALMRKDQGGRGGTIINIASTANLYRCSNAPIYSATKGAVLQFSNSLGVPTNWCSACIWVLPPINGYRMLNRMSLFLTSVYTTDHETLSRTGVRVFAICFGGTATTMMSGNFTSFDKVFEDSIVKTIRGNSWQSPEHAAREMLAVYKKADTGTVWLVCQERSALDITNTYNTLYDSMKELIV